jgi:chitin disaccharide deacetylase
MFFHTVFNRTVENFHRPFIIRATSKRTYGSKIASAKKNEAPSGTGTLACPEARKACAPLSTASPQQLLKVSIASSPPQKFVSKLRVISSPFRSLMKQLILNADDFGLTRGVNQGIIRAHRDGILTSATLMACGPAFDHAVELAKLNPRLGIGCHLVLVGGRPIAPREEIPSLVSKDGNLHDSLGSFVTRLSTGIIRPKEIERELRAQILKIRAAGIEPTHLDTHKHTHAHPVVMGVLSRVARELGIPRVRKPMENLRDSWESSLGERPVMLPELFAAAAARMVTPIFHSISRRYDLRSPDYFLGLARTGRLRPEALRRMIDAVQEGSTEIMLHPGISDAELQTIETRLSWQRNSEMDALVDPAVKSAIEEHGIRLITYGELN